MNNRSAVSVFFFVNGLIFASWASRLPRIQHDYSIDHSGLGFVLLAHAVGGFIAMPITGWLISTHGSRWMTTISGVFLPICFVTIAYIPNSTFLALPFFLMGASAGVMDVSMNAQAVAIEKSHAQPIMTMFHAMFSIGMVAGGLAGGLFTSHDLGISVHFAVVGSISLLTLLLLARYLYEDRLEYSRMEGESFVWPKGPMIGLGLIAFCGMLGEGAMSDWSTNYMKQVVAVSKDYQVIALTAFAGMMTVGRLFGDRGRAWYGDRQMMISGGGLACLGMILILSLIHPTVVILGFGIVGLGLSNIVPIVYSMAGNYSGVRPGVGIAMVTTIGYTGFMAGPPIIGLIADWFNLRLSLGLIGVLMIIMVILVFRSGESLSADR